MGNIVAIVSILLALIAAGSIAYIAWELTSENRHKDTGESAPARPAEKD